MIILSTSNKMKEHDNDIRRISNVELKKSRSKLFDILVCKKSDTFGIILIRPNIKIDNIREKLHMSSISETIFMVPDFSLLRNSVKFSSGL